MVALANAWAKDGADVTLITLASRTADVYPLDSAITRVDLDLIKSSSGAFRAISNNVARIRELRAALISCVPDIVISFMTTTNLLALIASRGLGCPVIVSERIFLSKQPPRGIWRIVYRPLYRLAAAVVAQTKRGAEDLEGRLGRPVVAIHNPVFPSVGTLVPARASADTQISPGVRASRTLLAMGRLSAQKGFDLLVTAFSYLAADHPQWNLMILGEGSERSSLTSQIAGLGLEERVHMPGFVENPRALMDRADIFVMSSRYEGMPNALLEAMAAGMPCVSFDCETGPSELIEDGVNGCLVEREDVRALAGALNKLMTDEVLAKQLSAKAKLVTEKFSIELIHAQWKGLATSVLGTGVSSDVATPPALER